MKGSPVKSWSIDRLPMTITAAAQLTVGGAPLCWRVSYDLHLHRFGLHAPGALLGLSGCGARRLPQILVTFIFLLYENIT